MSPSDPSAQPAADLFRFVERADFGDKACVVLGDQVLHYGGLLDLMRRTGEMFTELGIAMGARIVICSDHEMETLALYLAAMRLGVTPALIDPQSSADEARVLVRAARAQALFGDDRMLAAGGFEADLEPGGHVVPVRPLAHWGRARLFAGSAGVSDDSYPARLQRHSGDLALPVVPGDTSAFILFTSGTTSRPKGVEVSHAAVRAHMATMHRQYGYDETCRVINGLPLHHSDGINHGPVNIVAAGGTLLRTGPFSVQRLPGILGLVTQHAATHMITVPTVLSLISRLGDAFTDSFRTPHFRFVSSTAGPLEPGLWRGFEARFGTMVVNAYGLTETVCEGFYCGPTPETRRIGTIGKPIDLDVRIIDAAGRDVADGEMGELILRGSCVMKGYFDAPEETAAVLREGWLYTGDLAVRDADGFYNITGRKKNVVITGGVNVYPEDVSRTILQMPGITDAVTLGVPDPTFGERVVSCITVDGAAVTPGDVIAFCREHLAREKVPSHVYLIDEMPRGPAGKIALPQVKSLVAALEAEREQAARAAGGATRALGTRAAVEQQVLEIAARCFQVDVGALSLDAEPETTEGWNSLAHMDFLLALEAAFGVQIAPEAMLDIVTLGDAAEHLYSLGAAGAAP